MKSKKINKKELIKRIVLIAFILWVFVALYHQTKPLPEGISLEGQIYTVPEEDVEFLKDLTYVDSTGKKVTDHEIFNEIFDLIDDAEEFILIDMFLFNNDYPGKERLIELSSTLKNKLIAKKREKPQIDINFITDEINNFYGSYTSTNIKELQDAGINVIITDSTKLRDSNSAYSSIWRTYFQWFGTSGSGWIKHPLGNLDNKVTFRSYLKLLNTKANHRKVIIADKGEKIVSIVTSANPHDGSSFHSNVAIMIERDIWRDILESEKAVAKFSGENIFSPPFDFVKEKHEKQFKKSVQVQLLTEGKIKKNLLKDIDSTKSGEAIDLAMFYLSDRQILKSILKASERGVNVRIILDPNKDAFAREKNGIPNRQTAYELVKKSKGKIQIRWYDTKGEQYHTKMIIIKKSDRIIVYLGSANFTRRNMGDLNLETDVKLQIPRNLNLTKEFNEYFEKVWSNKDKKYTLDFEAYKDTSFTKTIIYRIQEATGLSSF